MAENLRKIRDTIGVDDKPISITVIEGITVGELGNNKLQAKGKRATGDVNCIDLEDNMIIPVHIGNNPNKIEEIEK